MKKVFFFITVWMNLTIVSFGQPDTSGKLTPAQLELQTEIKKAKDRFINKPVPVFKFTDIAGKKWNSKDLKGKVVVINFWFTSCQPCIYEMPLLNEVVAGYNNKGVEFIAPAPENDVQIKKFLQRYKFDYNIIPSSNDFIDKQQIENFPTHLVVDKKGIVRQLFIGYSNDIGKKLQEEINKLL
jgi:thiol-disulfide isomerase/thioredoxin